MSARAFKSLNFGLILFILLATYDGLIRKYLLADYEKIVFLLKDILLVILFAFFYKYRKHSFAYYPKIIRLIIVFYILWVFIEIFNFKTPNIFVGIWGFKAHVLYISMIILIPLLFSNIKVMVLKCSKLTPFLVIPAGLLTMFQSRFSGDSLINQAVRGGEDSIAYFGDLSSSDSLLIRASGPFSYITGLTSFQTFMLLFIIFLLTFNSKKFFLFISTILLLSTLPASGSRAVIVIYLFFFIISFLLLISNKYTKKTGWYFLFFSLVILVLSWFFSSELWAALFNRVDSIDNSDNDRFYTAFTNAFDMFLISGFLGFGSGTANYGAAAFVSPDQVLGTSFSWIPVYFEEESGRIVLELGIIGWFISILLRLAMLIWAILLFFKVRSSELKFIGILGINFMLLAVWQGNGVFAPPYMAFGFWFIVALMGMAEYQYRIMKT
jgi:hypothetical protein